MVASIRSSPSQLDATVVNVSRSSLVRNLQASLPATEWLTRGSLLSLALLAFFLLPDDRAETKARSLDFVGFADALLNGRHTAKTKT